MCKNLDEIWIYLKERMKISLFDITETNVKFSLYCFTLLLVFELLIRRNSGNDSDK